MPTSFLVRLAVGKGLPSASRTRGVLMLSVVLLLSFTAKADQAREYEFDIPQQGIETALSTLATQAGALLLVPYDLVQPVDSKPVSGRYTVEDALVILLQDTGLTGGLTEGGVITISRAGAIDNQGRTIMAQNHDNLDGNKAPTKRRGLLGMLAVVFSAGVGAQDVADVDGEELRIEEIVVTGTNIRGVQGASPIAVFSRDDIDLTGVGSIPQFIQTLPQNFGGGISESAGAGNANSGNGINLRGLGNDSTLVLLNGRRLAPAGTGNFVDVSMIPLSALDQVEVLTDGASAIYGSDAVGGVVNFKLREDYEGAETRLRFGTATSGDLDDIQIGQSFGGSWDSGRALISMEYQSRDNLDSEDRSFTVDEPDPTDALPTQERSSVFLTVSQDLTDALSLFGDGFYSKRESDVQRVQFFSLNQQLLRQETEQFGATLGGNLELAGDWQAELVGSYSQNDVSGDALSPDGSVRQFSSFLSSNSSLQAKADGPLLELPGGMSRLAVGAQFRTETYEETPASLTRSGIDVDRDVGAVFGELFLPLIGADNRRFGIDRFEVTIAGRYEDYSDFGASTDGKIGVLWAPFNGLSLRGTYGTSFRAPLFRELSGEISGIFLGLPDTASPSGTTLTVFGQGANPNLDPETATTWTAGFDYSPPSIPNVDFKLTYFEIDFEDRIGDAGAGFDALTNPRFAFLVDRNPDTEFLAFLEAQQDSLNFTGVPFTDAEALYRGFLTNLSRVQTKGFDASINYSVDSAVGQFLASLNASYLFEQSEQLLASDTPLDIAGTVGNPPNLKVRANLNWRYEQVSTNIGINYIDDFENIQFDPVESVDDWATVDLSINYEVEGEKQFGPLSDSVISFVVLNAFDTDPPFVRPLIGGSNFDVSNASPQGRTIALQVTKQW